MGARVAIPQILQLFLKYDIHATWAIVGMLYCKDKQELLSYFNTMDIPYENTAFSPIKNLSNVGENETVDPYHFGRSLIDMIRETSNQEIGTHTFSHYYCLEDGQNMEHFVKDLVAVSSLEKTASLVFPRNQVNLHYLHVCKELGVKAYRGNEKNWMYKAHTAEKNSSLKRLCRLIDAYMNISGNHTYCLKNIETDPIVNIPSSRFLRPYNSRLSMLEQLRLIRIKKGLTRAAKKNELYHLWWHPHNFGRDTKENLQFLEEILKHVDYLKNKYNFQSMHMRDVTDVLKVITAKVVAKSYYFPFIVVF
ncbi:polysaccharide deacetylase family protein [Psychrobacillus antarcticus]|uniref:polysaccharide deacetylase family protein n=1 Tax=Psychrobacillus antarcticus TaxID=2879115 RepID=UPI002407823C|nr:hypothetical protein [Psychrobacillus antarcticus]